MIAIAVIMTPETFGIVDIVIVILGTTIGIAEGAGHEEKEIETILRIEIMSSVMKLILVLGGCVNQS